VLSNKDKNLYFIIFEYILWLVATLVFSWALANIISIPDVFKHIFFYNWQLNLFVFTLAFSCLYFLFLFASTLFYHKYKDAYTYDTLPVCTVLVPAYNEGKHVYDTIISILDSDYPKDKLEVITINDGSKDDTLEYLKLAQKYSSCVEVINLEKNQGKKHALYLGMKKAKGEFIATVDSDSIVEKTTLKKLVQPFANKKIGAVAGTITGKNCATNSHVCMLDVMLIFGCEFLRKAQSVTGNVFCTPGALSCYRKSAILPVIDQWLGQTFLGEEARIGEDRAIATLLLQEGFWIVHQDSAKAETCLPQSYWGVCKMLLRWTRSDIRENILMMPFVLKKVKFHSCRYIFLFVHWISLFINMMLPLIFIPLFIYSLITTHYLIEQLSLICLSSFIWSLIPAVVCYKEKKSIRKTIWAFGFGFYSLIGLSWLSIYALLTIKNSNWLTREKSSIQK
jgi:hyaluronan synthase